jgi:hypothetical protein
MASSRGGGFGLAGVLVTGGIYLYFNLFLKPQAPFLLGGDQTYFWTDGQRMLFGELPYKDFFQFTPPGTDVFYWAMFKWFGPRIPVTNLVVLGLGLALCWICYSISRQIMSVPWASLAALLFLTFVYGKVLNATHHWFSVLIILCAARVAMQETTSLRVGSVGVLLGVASFFTHTHALAAALAYVVFLVWERWKQRQPADLLLQRAAVLFLGFGVTWVLCNSYTLSTVGFRQLWYYQVTFVRKYVDSKPGGAFLGMPEMPTLRRIPAVSQYLIVYALLAVGCPWSLWECWVRRNDPHFGNWRQLTLLSLLGATLSVEIAFSLNWLRAFAVAPPAIVLAIAWLARYDRRPRWAMSTIWAGVVLLGLYQTWTKHRRPYIVAEFPAGKVALGPEAYEKLSWVRQHSAPGDFFFQPLVPSMYLPLGLRSPVFVEGLGPNEQSRPEFVELTIRQLEQRQVQYVLWSPHTDQVRPGPQPADHLEPFRAFLHSHYERVWTFSDHDEIWRRK